MRNFKWIGLLICVIIPFLQSCLNDTETWSEDTNLAIGTICLKETNDKINFYFALDNGKTINPVVFNDNNYKAIEGQRAFIYFKMIDNQSVLADNSFDYNAEILYVENILTKKIIPLTFANNDSIGNDLIDISNVWMAQNYVNIECKFYSSNKELPHMLNLTYDINKKIIDDEGYICLQFRHNAFNDLGTYTREGLISFKLEHTLDKFENVAGIKIYANTNNGGIQTYILDLENHTQPNTKNTSNNSNINLL